MIQSIKVSQSRMLTNTRDKHLKKHDNKDSATISVMIHIESKYLFSEKANAVLSLS